MSSVNIPVDLSIRAEATSVRSTARAAAYILSLAIAVLVVVGAAVPLKLVLCVDMLMGRLEVVAVLVLFYPRNWIARR